MPSTPEQRFEVLGELGRGGMGVVYRARDRESGREVALKVVLQELEPRRLERFRREGEITARLGHPGIVRIHSSGIHEGRPYLAYELVRGRELAEVLREVNLERRVELIRDTARALGYAHSQGVIHRDMKPENVLVDAEGRVRVADFGLATARDLERLTLSGAIVGTPSYMSPEQIAGDGKKLGPPTDVWALGVMLYEALTGKLPFELGSNLLELAGKILTADVERPRSIDAGLPRALEAICLQALSREMTDRYADGNALADDLDAYLGGKRSGLGRPATRRGPSPALVGGSSLLLALVGGVLWFALQAVETPAVVESAPETKAPEDPAPLRPGEIGKARRELTKVLMLEAPRRHAELTRWLEANPRHPDLERAKAERQSAQLEFPLHVFNHYRAGGHPEGFVYGWFVDERRIVTRGWDRIFLWELSRPEKPILTIKADAIGQGLGVAPGGEQLVLGKGRGGSVFDLGKQEFRALPGYPKEALVRLVTFSAGGHRLAVASRENGIHLFSWPECRRLRVIPKNYARAIALSSDGRTIVAGGGSSMDRNLEKMSSEPDFVGVWEIDTGEAVYTQDRKAPPTAVAFSPDGRYVAVGDTVGRLFAIELATSEHVEFEADGVKVESGVLYSSMAHAGELRGLTFTSDGVTLISAGQKRDNGHGENELKFWDFATHQELRKVAPSFPPALLSSSPSKTRILLGSNGVGKVELRAVQAR